MSAPYYCHASPWADRVEECVVYRRTFVGGRLVIERIADCDNRDAAWRVLRWMVAA